MRNWLKTILFLSAFSPVLLSLALIRYQAEGMSTAVWQLVAVGLLGSMLPPLIILGVAKQLEEISITLKKVEANDFVAFTFIFSYIFPFVGKSIDMSFVAICVAVGAATVILWGVSSIPAHPLLNLLRFKFYKVEAANGMVYTVISRREILDPKHVKTFKKISSTLYLAL